MVVILLLAASSSVGKRKDIIKIGRDPLDETPLRTLGLKSFLQRGESGVGQDGSRDVGHEQAFPFRPDGPVSFNRSRGEFAYFLRHRNDFDDLQRLEAQTEKHAKENES